MARRRYPLIVAAALIAGGFQGCSKPRAASTIAGTMTAGQTTKHTDASTTPRAVLSRYEDLANTRFGPLPVDPHKPPQVAEIQLPKVLGLYAIWGSTGRDDRGHIWAGVPSCRGA